MCLRLNCKAPSLVCVFCCCWTCEIICLYTFNLLELFFMFVRLYQAWHLLSVLRISRGLVFENGQLPVVFYVCRRHGWKYFVLERIFDRLFENFLGLNGYIIKYIHTFYVSFISIIEFNSKKNNQVKMVQNLLTFFLENTY